MEVVKPSRLTDISTNIQYLLKTRTPQTHKSKEWISAFSFLERYKKKYKTAPEIQTFFLSQNQTKFNYSISISFIIPHEKKKLLQRNSKKLYEPKMTFHVVTKNLEHEIMLSVIVSINRAALSHLSCYW